MNEFADNNLEICIKMEEGSLKGQKILWETGKLIVMSNFFFSPSVFKTPVLQKCKDKGLVRKGLNQFQDYPLS